MAPSTQTPIDEAGTVPVEYLDGVPVLYGGSALPHSDAGSRPIEWFNGVPVLYEDDDGGDFMGDSNVHTISNDILRFALLAHFRNLPRYQVFSNMNLYYLDGRPNSYVSPDQMVVEPYTRLPEDLTSYRIGVQGPGPVATLEVLSQRTAQQRDLDEKVVAYENMRVAEYIVVDVTGKFLPERLLLKRLMPDESFKDEQDPDGGVTSRLGFRVIIDADGQLRVLNAATGEHYMRPDEATDRLREASERAGEADKRAGEADKRVRELEAELLRLRAETSKEAPRA
jgi:hypothetical protein